VKEWRRVGWLQSIQSRPQDGQPLSGLSEHAPWLAYNYLNNHLKASGVKIISDCDGKHTRVVGNHDRS
jgi:hypothetical protein